MSKTVDISCFYQSFEFSKNVFIWTPPANSVPRVVESTPGCSPTSERASTLNIQISLWSRPIKDNTEIAEIYEG